VALLVPAENGETVVVRWIWADDEHELVAFALRGEAVARTEPDVVIHNPAHQWRMFNAAADLLAHGNPSRRLELPVGRIRVQTATLESGRNAAIIHRISKCVEPGASADGPSMSS
jgi:hypothetical protein